jgi:hypothetical protein
MGVIAVTKRRFYLAPMSALPFKTRAMFDVGYFPPNTPPLAVRREAEEDCS